MATVEFHGFSEGKEASINEKIEALRRNREITLNLGYPEDKINETCIRVMEQEEQALRIKHNGMQWFDVCSDDEANEWSVARRRYIAELQGHTVVVLSAEERLERQRQRRGKK